MRYVLEPVRLSVCLSHGWNSQKRLKLGLYNFHRTVGPFIYFLADRTNGRAHSLTLQCCVRLSPSVVVVYPSDSLASCCRIDFIQKFWRGPASGSLNNNRNKLQFITLGDLALFHTSKTAKMIKVSRHFIRRHGSVPFRRKPFRRSLKKYRVGHKNRPPTCQLIMSSKSNIHLKWITHVKI